jgi:hypothetical protein
MKHSLVLSFLFALSAPLSMAVTTPQTVLEIEGKIYPKDTHANACAGMFKGLKCTEEGFGKFHAVSTQEGDLIHSVSTFSGPEGAQVIEEAWEKDGHVQKARIENKALGKTSEFEVRGQKVHYKLTEKDGDVSEDTDNYEENLVVPSTMMSYMRPRFHELLEGKTIKLRVAVLDRQEAYTFNVKKFRDEKTADGQDVVVLQMAPNSFIIKALVDPMYFYLNPKSGEMFGFEGRSALRRKEGDKYKELSVRTAYEYKVNTYNKLAQVGASQQNCATGSTLIGTGKDAKCTVKSQ